MSHLNVFAKIPPGREGPSIAEETLGPKSSHITRLDGPGVREACQWLPRPMGEASSGSSSAAVVGPNRWLGINRGGGAEGVALCGLSLPLDPGERGG